MKPKQWFFLGRLLWMVAASSTAWTQTQPGEAWDWRNPLPQGNSLLGVTWVGGQFLAVGEGGRILASPDGVGWRTRESGTTATLRGLAWSGSRLVAVGQSGTIVTSPDAVTWTPQTSGSTVHFGGVTWGGGWFAAVGANGAIRTSPDGVAWTAAPSGTFYTLTAVTWANGLFVAVGENGVIRTSTNAVSWAAQASGTTATLRDVLWSNNLFVAVGDNGAIRISEDGVTWTAAASGTSSSLYGVAWSGRLFVALGPNGYLQTSPDGRVWTSAPGRVAPVSLYGIDWASGQFVVVGVYGAIHTSPDGETWAARVSGETQDLQGVAWNGSQFLAVGSYGTIVTAPNGVEWTKRAFKDNYSTLAGVAWANGLFVIVGGNMHSYVLATSPDGTTWTSRNAGLSAKDMLVAVTWADNRFVAVGHNGAVVTSTNGVTWTKAVSGTTVTLNGVAGNGEMFVAVGNINAVLTSPDGTDWTDRNVWAVYRGDLFSVAWGHDQFVAVGGAILTSPDGITWTRQVSGTALRAVTWNGLNFVAVGDGGSVLTSADGVTWTARPSGCARDLSGVAWDGSQFVAVGDRGTILGSGTAGSRPGRILSPLRSGTLVAGDTLRFRGASLDHAQADYSWDFGDGRSARVPNPGLVRYPGTGAFEVVYSAAVSGATPEADTRSYTVVADRADIGDLEVTDVHVAGTLAVGTPVQISYRVRNAGPGAAGPAWHDALYLSRDPYPDASDLLLRSVVVTEDLGAGQFRQSSMEATLPAAYAGGCHLIVVVNDQWGVVERRRLNNEQATPITGLVPVLAAGTSTSVAYAAGRVEHYFKLTAAGGRNLVLDLEGVPPGLEVFLQFGGLPTAGGDYAYRARGGESLVIPAATAGEWFAMVRGAPDAAGVYTLGFSMEAMVLSGISPVQHPAARALSLTLAGAGFVRPLTAKLVSGDDQVYLADAVDVDSYLQATARFPAGAVPPGTYAVRVERDGQVAEAETALEVVAGGQGRLKTDLILPGTFGYHMLATLYVEYANVGDAAMPAPVLVLTATQNGRAGAILTLDQHRLKSGFWTPAMPLGFANVVQFIASGETPGILQAGESARVPVYYAGWQQPWDMKYAPLEWQVGVLEADNTTAIDWNSLKAGMRPEYVREDAWDVLWANFTAEAGSTWGDYVGMLTRNAQYLHRHGVAVKDLESLLAFSIRRADGLSPVGRLAGAADAAVRSPGLPLFFARAFLQPISRRFELGDLGRGWTHNWRQTLRARPDGAVVISDMTGTPRLFNPDSRYTGRYLAQPGDQGDLRAAGEGFRLTEANGGVRFYRDGRLEFVEDPNGNRITCQYAEGRLTRLAHSSGAQVELTYNGEGYIRSATDSLGRQTRYHYDGEHLTSVQAHDGRVTTYTYVTAGAAQHALAQIVLPNGNTRSYGYDGAGRLAATWRNAGEEKVRFSAADGGCVAVTDALNNTTRLFFDHWARLIKTENPLGEIVQVHSDAWGRPLSVTDPDGGLTGYVYDERGNVTEITDALRRSTRFVHARNFNRLSRVTDALQRRTEYVYDTRGNLTSVAYPDGSVEAWTRDDEGKPVAWTNRRGRGVTFEYDSAGRLTRKGYADGSSAFYRYNEQGRLAEAGDAGGVTSFSYNEQEYLARVAYPGDRWLAFTYDAMGRRTASEDQTGYRIEYHYDASSRLSRVSSGGGDDVTYVYDELGRVARQTLGNGVYAEHSYDAAGRLLSLVNHLPGGEVLSRFGYTYDRRGRRTAMQTHYGTWAYSYDAAGQLTRAALASTNAEIANQELIYEYDPLGNRVRTMVNGVEEAYGVNEVNQYTTVGNRTYAYDLDGNLVGQTGPEGTTVYTYNDENRLVGVTRGASEWRYSYDALGNRVAVDENGAVRHFVLDPVGLGNLVAAYDDGGQVRSRHAHGLGLASRWSPEDGVAYYSFDPMGNTSELTGAAGERVNAYAYRPFGELILDQQAVPDAFRFMGQVGITADSAGLHCVRWRHYDGSMGRFASVDPLGLGAGDLNFYAYAANQPTVAFDPTGLYFECSVASFGLKTAVGVGEVFGGLFMLAGAVAVAPPTAGASTPVCVLGLAVTVGGVYDISTGVMGMVGNGLALAADRAGLLSDGGRAAIDRFWAPLNPSIPGLIVGAATTDWETGEFNGDTAAITDAVVGVVSSVVSPGRSLASVGQSVAEGGADLGLQYGFCAHNQDPVTPPDPLITLSSGFLLPPVAPSDPNAKTGVAGVGAANFVEAGRLLSYRIDFENHALATAPAQFVSIRDPLSAHLDWSTLELAEIGFGRVTIPVPPGRQRFETTVEYAYTDADYDWVLEVQVEVWVEGGTLCVNFSSIDGDTGLPPPVDRGFLMPETEPPTGRGQGHVTYLIRPKPGVSTGTAVRNVATIQFDFGETIDTNQVDPHDPAQGTDPAREALVTLDGEAPTSTVQALPERVGETFTVDWSGADAGSGVVSYDVYVSTNSGPWGLWLTATRGTAAVFTGAAGQGYAFYSVARDGVGHVEDKVAGVEAVTTVGLANRPPTLTPVGTQEIEAGTLFSLALEATDPDPGDRLSFGLVEGPEGMEVGAGTGVLSWTPPLAQGSSTNTVRITVSDDGEPPLSDSIEFSVRVRGGAVDPPAIAVVFHPVDNQVLVRVESGAGRTYFLEGKDRLEDPGWTQLGQVRGDGAVVTLVDPDPSPAARFYRVRVE